MKMTKDEVLKALDEIRAAIVADDSFEGNFSYTVMQEHLGPGEFEVEGGYRIGNSEGQGGFRLIPPTEQVA